MSMSLSGRFSPRATDPNSAACRTPRARNALSLRRNVSSACRAFIRGIYNSRCATRRYEMDALARLRELALPFAQLMGIEFVEASAARVVAEMAVRAELCTQP